MASLHRVAQDDTLPALAARYYGDPGLAAVLSAANALSPSDHLVEGKELIIPYLTTRHEVRPGDTLPALAIRYYGEGALCPAPPTTLSRPTRSRPVSSC
jgi:nucleoid-associated protein YgaU